jgi:hypothetical protein
VKKMISKLLDGKAAWPACALILSLLLPAVAFGQANYVAEGSEYLPAGVLLGDQVFPDASIRTTGGILVWEDNATDGSGSGISARRLDSSLSGWLGSFRVNQQGANDQNRPRTALLNDGGAVIVWQGGKQGFQKIYARFLSSSNTWVTGDLLVNTFTNSSQLNPAVTVLANGNVVVAWGSFNQENASSLQGVYAQLFSPSGDKIGGEFRVNQTTPFNQRLPALASLSDGRFVVTWVSEQQRFENSVDIYGQLYSAAGVAVGSEFLINTTTNITGHPSVAGSSDGGFLVAWSERDSINRSNNWDVIARPFTSAGVGAVARRVNAMTYGDQVAPRISSIGTDYLMVWTSLGQDGSREGVYGQFLRGDGSLAGGEFRVNSTTISLQEHPTVASDRVGRYLVAWTSFAGAPGGFDLFAQRYASTGQPLPPLDAPFVSVVSSNILSVTWPALAGFSISNYEVYADGAAMPTASVTNTMWDMTGLAPGSTHSFRVAYVLTDGRRSPLSEPTTNTTFGALWYFNVIPQEWMSLYFGSAFWVWPSPNADSDGDGASNYDEFRAGTNPNDADSVLRVRLQRTAQGVFLNWNTEPGLMYQVVGSTNMTTWTKLGGPRFAAGYLDSVYLGFGSRGYYKVERLR